MGSDGITRRGFLEATFATCAATAAGVPATAAAFARAPAIVQADAARPATAQGAAVGDVAPERAVIWSRTDRPSRMVVEYATSDRFQNALSRTGPSALESTDYTCRLLLTDLPPGQRIFYRVRFQDLSDLRTFSAPIAGSFRTPELAGATRDITLAWSADTVGQGWGINPDWGGLRLYETMRQAEPDVFINCGDTIYADQPVVAEVRLDDGKVWKNIVTEAKSKVAETLDEYRGNYKYNLLDDHMRRFNAEVAQIVLWDDHEVRDNWYERRDLSGDERYQVRSMALLAARARQAFLEFNPIGISGEDRDRIHRAVSCGPLVDVFALDLRTSKILNSGNRQPSLTPESRILGEAQLASLKAQLRASTATWKVIASDLPIGLIVRDGPERFEGVANADPGPPLGRELEIADLLQFIKTQRIRNVVWVTADVHYCAAHHYDPSRARFTDFDPFWEFVTGPLNAGTFGPNTLDATFGPEARFVGVPRGMKGNRPPSDGFQFFGTMRVDARTRAMTVRLHDLSGRVLYSVELPPAAAM